MSRKIRFVFDTNALISALDPTLYLRRSSRESEIRVILKKEPNQTYNYMSWQERIVLNPKILVGKPTIKGTRLAVEFIIDLLAEGWNEAEILKNYPGLTAEDIQACLSYASVMLKSEKVYPLSV